MTVTYIVATLGRESLLRTVRSIECWPGDEILIASDRFRVDSPYARYVDVKPGGDWGHTERNVAMPAAKGDFIAHIDDDDVYVPGTRQLFDEAMSMHNGPTVFRMQFPNGITLWNEPGIACGNVGTPMFLMPNEKDKFGTWGSFVGGDCHFLETSKWGADEYVWRREVIALLGHNT